jgi:hypothetical protein
VAVALAGATATVAGASDLLTVNTTSAYVDPALAAEFVTVPNLCTEPVGTQGTSLVGCNELGARAVAAYQGDSPYGDVYWEPEGSFLQGTNAFVPGNEGSVVGNTGYAQIFSQHKYDLFGRSGDRMGVWTREEFLFLSVVPNSGGGITNGGTAPGADTLLKLIAAILVQNEGATTFSLGGLTFNVADLPTYERITGFTSGKRTTVVAWCNANLIPALCVNPGVAAEFYALANFPQVAPASCGPAGFLDCVNRDQWVDQVVAGYVQAWDTLGGDAHFAENFRSQVGFDPHALILDSGTAIWTDFRLEQSTELSGAFTTRGSDRGDTITPGDNQDGIAGRQTFQAALATISGGVGGIVVNVGQMVSQDVEGYFMSCLNCEQPGGNTHGFEPAKQDLTFMPYTGGWDSVPTIDHGGL